MCIRDSNEFELIAPEGISTRLIPQGRFVTNDPMTLVRWLTAGAGIAYVPLMWVINEINRGELELSLIHICTYTQCQNGNGLLPAS